MSLCRYKYSLIQINFQAGEAGRTMLLFSQLSTNLLSKFEFTQKVGSQSSSTPPHANGMSCGLLWSTKHFWRFTAKKKKKKIILQNK